MVRCKLDAVVCSFAWSADEQDPLLCELVESSCEFVESVDLFVAALCSLATALCLPFTHWTVQIAIFPLCFFGGRVDLGRPEGSRGVTQHFDRAACRRGGV